MQKAKLQFIQATSPIHGAKGLKYIYIFLLENVKGYQN